MVAKYKLFRCGNDKCTGGGGILMAEKWVEYVLEVYCISDIILSIKINVGVNILTILSIYAQQVDDMTKDDLDYELQSSVARCI